MKRTTQLMGLCLVCVVCLSPVVLGQERDPAALVQEATDLAREERFQEAVAIWLDILGELDDRSLPGVHRKLGLAYKRMGMLPESWHYLTAYLESSGKEDTSAAGWLQEVETALRQIHVKVSLTCNPHGSRLSLPASQPSPSSALRAGSLVASHSCPVAWWFKPGKHKVSATAPGHKPRTLEIFVQKRGDSGMREIRLAAVAVHRRPVDRQPKKSSRALEWALIGSGLALGVTGGIFHGLGYSKNEDLHQKYLNEENYSSAEQAQTLYDEARQEEVRPKEIAAYVLYGVGGAAVLAGIVTWAVRKPGRAGEKTSGVMVSPMLTAGSGTGALLTFEF